MKTRVVVKLAGEGLTVDPWVARITEAEDGIEWQAIGCKIKIELDHPQHFSLDPSGYDKRVQGTLTRSQQNGTFHYGISVLGKARPEIDSLSKVDGFDAYKIDPDYKVDR